MPGKEKVWWRVSDYTPEEKLAIVMRAKELLDGGRRWVRGAWLTERILVGTGKRVECFCLDGALAYAAYDLGILPKKRGWRGKLSSSGVSWGVSVGNYIQRKFGYTTVVAYNDSSEQSWEDIEAVLNARIRQLRQQIARQAKK